MKRQSSRTNVVKLNGRPYARPRSPDRVLKDNVGLGLTEVLVIGVCADGETVVGGSPPDPANALWLMEMARKRLTQT